MDRQSITILCQLVKDFFLDKKDKLLIGGDPDFENMLQAVRCCNDQYLMTLIKSMEADKQSQLGLKLIWLDLISDLAFLIIHLQTAVQAGRLPGELSCCFGKVIVAEGARNKNDPKELIQQMIQLSGSFYQGIVNPKNSTLDPFEQAEAEWWAVLFMVILKFHLGKTQSKKSKQNFWRSSTSALVNYKPLEL